MEEAAVSGGFSQLANSRSLFKLRRNAFELRVEGTIFNRFCAIGNESAGDRQVARVLDQITR
jgi:hypothetical protein